MNKYRKGIVFALCLTLFCSFMSVPALAEDDPPAEETAEITEETVIEEEPVTEEETVIEEVSETEEEIIIEEEEEGSQEHLYIPENPAKAEQEPKTEKEGPAPETVYDPDIAIADGQELTLNVKYTVNIETAGEQKIFYIVPTQTGYYTFRSYGSNCDPYVTLLRGDKTEIDQNDDDGNSLNFRSVSFLEAGTQYVYYVRLFSENTTGSFEVMLQMGGCLFGYYGDSYIDVQPGESADLRVVATGDTDRATVQWYKKDTVINGATSGTLSLTNINESAYYICRCNDGIGFETDIYFTVHVENGLSVERVGDYDRIIKYNDPFYLQIKVTVTDNTNLSISWHECYYDPLSGEYKDEIVSKSNLSYYSKEHATKSREYYAEVTDRYKNTEVVDFYVTIENNLYAEADGGQDKTVKPGGSVTLKVKVTADDTSGLTYTWGKWQWDESLEDVRWIALATSTTYTLKNIYSNDYYVCYVTDKCGNISSVYFYITINNNLKITDKGGSIISVVKYGVAYLETEVTAYDTSNLRYEWYTSNYDYEVGDFVESFLAETTSGDYTYANVQQPTGFRIVVYDQYGGSAETNMHVNIIEDYQIALRKNFIVLTPGESETLIADGLPHKNWYSLVPDVADVDQNGTVTVKKLGVSYIHCYDDDDVYGDSCTVRGGFSDVKDISAYYFEPVYWAFDNNITVGYGGAYKFSPNVSCTREQIVTFLWRLMGEPEPETESSFSDVAKDAWYYKPITWAYENGITTGLNDGTGRFGVGQPCTREQCVTFLYRAAGKPAVGEHTEFTDVTSDRYYYDSISWAAANGITVGLNDGTGRFGVGQKCTRAMIVTFLFRYYVYQARS